MTVWIPLPELSSELPSSPPFLRESRDSKQQLQKVVTAITKARRIVGRFLDIQSFRDVTHVPQSCLAQELVCLLAYPIFAAPMVYFKP